MQSDKFVWRRYGVQIGLFPVVEISVWLPDPLQHRDAERESVFIVAGKRQAPVDPRLPEITVHRVRLKYAHCPYIYRVSRKNIARYSYKYSGTINTSAIVNPI